MFLLDDILLAPAYGVAWIGRKLRDAAAKELTDEDSIREELLTLQWRLDEGEIGLEEFEQHEEILMQRLDEARKMKEQFEKEGVET